MFYDSNSFDCLCRREEGRDLVDAWLNGDRVALYTPALGGSGSVVRLGVRPSFRTTIFAQCVAREPGGTGSMVPRRSLCLCQL